MKCPPIIALAAVALTSCDRPTPQASSDAAEATPRVRVVRHAAAPAPLWAATSDPVAARAPEAAPVLAAAAPAPDSLAPKGVFFLLAQTSAKTDEGVIELPPGTRVEVISPGEYIDSAGHVFNLRDAQVTNDLRLAGPPTPPEASSEEPAAPAAVSVPTAPLPPPADAAAPEPARAAAPAAPPAPVASAAPEPFPSLEAAVAGPITPLPPRPPAPPTPPPLGRATLQTSSSLTRGVAAATPMGFDRRPVFGSGGVGAVHSRQEDNGYTDVFGNKHWKDIRGNWHVTRPK